MDERLKVKIIEINKPTKEECQNKLQKLSSMLSLKWVKNNDSKKDMNKKDKTHEPL